MGVPESQDAEEEDDLAKKQLKIQAVVGFLEAKKITFYKGDVFKFFNVTTRSGWRLLNKKTDLSRNNDQHRIEKRGRRSKLTKENIREMDRILRTEGFNATSITWTQLGSQVGLESSIHEKMISAAMGDTMHYHKCLECTKGWVSPSTAEDRLRFAREKLYQYPNPENWIHIRFSTETHFGWGSQKQLRMIQQRPGVKHCSDCLDDELKPKSAYKNPKRFHYWAAVGYNFKSDIIFYEVPSATVNGRLSHKEYLNQILEPTVLPWIQRGDDFVLQEDGDPNHGMVPPSGRPNPVAQWKEKHGLKHYFNYPHSSDLSVIENCWEPVKQHISKYSYKDDETTKELIRQGWARVTQHFINERVLSMPYRVEQVITNDGKLTEF
jgi:hypothetical protein